MSDWKKEVEKALTLFHYEVLEGKGKISHKMAALKAEGEYDKYKVIQDKNYVSDFDKLLNETKQIENNQFYYKKVKLLRVRVLTPSLNKSFKFQSDWPYNNSQVYLLQTLLSDIQVEVFN